VTKSSADKRKILAERRWFEEIPSAIKLYTPSIIGYGSLESGEQYYKVEYFSSIPLNEVFVHGLNPPFFGPRCSKL
jgi:hypothetical protein